MGRRPRPGPAATEPAVPGLHRAKSAARGVRPVPGSAGHIDHGGRRDQHRAARVEHGERHLLPPAAARPHADHAGPAQPGTARRRVRHRLDADRIRCPRHPVGRPGCPAGRDSRRAAGHVDHQPVRAPRRGVGHPARHAGPEAGTAGRAAGTAGRLRSPDPGTGGPPGQRLAAVDRSGAGADRGHAGPALADGRPGRRGGLPRSRRAAPRAAGQPGPGSGHGGRRAGLRARGARAGLRRRLRRPAVRGGQSGRDGRYRGSADGGLPRRRSDIAAGA